MAGGVLLGKPILCLIDLITALYGGLALGLEDLQGKTVSP